jgi:hypothetical protein
MIPGVFTTYSPLLKESLHLPVHLSYFLLFVCAVDERKENKDFCFVSWKITLKNQTNDSQYRKMHRCTLIAKGLEPIEWFCWDFLLSRLVFFSSFGCQAFNVAYILLPILSKGGMRILNLSKHSQRMYIFTYKMWRCVLYLSFFLLT